MEHTGQLLMFSARVFRDLPTAVRLYPSEVFRQSAYLIRSNGLVVLFMLFMLGALLGITGTFLFEGVGLESYVAAINAVPLMRGVIEIVFGWILAAKAGCGIVAELGAMRISEEIDAMEVMGIRPIPYLASTRLAASLIVLPFLFITALGVHFLAARLFFVDLLSTVSAGGFTYVLFLLQSFRDFANALIWGTLVGVIVTVVSCFYGYNARGGPVGVGRNTAQAMLVNLVLISVTAMILAQLFYGHNLDEAFGT
ncbi:ABC transporter permease [Amycolatopsis sp. K13G38]|uniref:ABC transporter permease n=1 Tax=Amycolatopsis acididurans TaxID=2724524 RepID=A0ABX1J7B5_9PSEU|nr:ABC transporter permease [Amycolatopsis acididurans]